MLGSSYSDAMLARTAGQDNCAQSGGAFLGSQAGSISTGSPGWACSAPPLESRAALHSRPFRLTHDLSSNPIFTPEALVTAAKAAALRNDDAFYHVGDIAVADHWTIGPQHMSVADLVGQIQTSNAWVILKHVEKEAAYGAVLDEFAAFVRDMAGPGSARDLRNPEMLAIVTSPRRITPFHFDAEVNFLVQVHGTKEVWICDPEDRSVITEEEIELYYAGNLAAGKFKPGAEKKARHFLLKPGDAVHIPTHSAHWVRNGDEISVSLSLNFEFPASRHKTKYLAQRVLRKLRVPAQAAATIARGPAAEALVWSAAAFARARAAVRRRRPAHGDGQLTR